MSQNEAVRLAQSLYEQGNYLGAAQSSLELMKNEETAKQGHLIFTKAFIFLIPHAQDEEKINTLYSSAGDVAKRITSLEEFFAAENEIKEAFEEWHREKFTTILSNLEQKLSLDYWGAFISLPVKYIEVGLILSVTMRNQPNIKKLAEAEGGWKEVGKKIRENGVQCVHQ